jgi:hypothetical protein
MDCSIIHKLSDKSSNQGGARGVLRDSGDHGTDVRVTTETTENAERVNQESGPYPLLSLCALWFDIGFRGKMRLVMTGSRATIPTWENRLSRHAG